MPFGRRSRDLSYGVIRVYTTLLSYGSLSVLCGCLAILEWSEMRQLIERLSKHSMAVIRLRYLIQCHTIVSFCILTLQKLSYYYFINFVVRTIIIDTF